jgi:hypothetical protein
LGFKFGHFALGVLCVIGQVELCHAQGSLDVTATVSAVQVGSTYDYTVTVDNAADSVAFGTFWYGWVPGVFEMGTAPGSVTPASGWTDSEPTGGSPTEYSIEFNTATALAPGSSVQFGFSSTESPSALYAGGANNSFVYTGSTAFTGSGAQVNVTAVPEPSSIALMLSGLTAGGWLIRRRL